MASKKKKEKRPDRTTMEGMIWNANHVLDAALDPETDGIPPVLFQNCKGIVLMSVVTAGFIFSGHSGSGVMMAKTDDGTWSAPTAVGVVGYGGGAIAGAETQDALIFIMDDETMKDFTDKLQTRMGGKASVSLGKLARDADVGIEAPNKGTVTVNYRNGAFGGVSIEVGTLGPRKQADNKFYGKKHLTPRKVMYESKVEIPVDSGIPDLHKKLRLLAGGMTWTPSQADMNKSQRLLVEANEAGEKAREQEDDIVQVGQEEEEETIEKEETEEK